MRLRRRKGWRGEPRAPMMTSLQLCLLAARAHGKEILDGVYNDLGHEDGFRAKCIQGRDLGFDGKTRIHPSQLTPCNQIFSPSAEEVETARRVIAAFDQAQIGRAAVVTVDGTMIESLHVEDAQRTVARASAIAGMNPPLE